MPDPISSPDEDVFERRLRPRTVINRGALIFYAGRAGVENCTVRDVTMAWAFASVWPCPSHFRSTSNNRLCQTDPEVCLVPIADAFEPYGDKVRAA
jgi:hypothetical protein